MPRLPDIVDDTTMTSASQDAAESDVMSGAYDEFLFSEENLVQMPYERMVDDQLALTQQRLRDHARRAVLRERQRLISVQSDVQQLEHRRAGVLEQIEVKEAKLADELEILEGRRTGRAELLWPGTPPQQTTLPNAFLRLMLPYTVFLIVGFVDVFIIYYSFLELFPAKQWEPILFTAPAVGVQIVFPHFIGDRINLLVRGFRHRLLVVLELLMLLAIWISFVITLAVMRMNFIEQNFPGIRDEMYIAVFIGSICMLLGLGLWLLLVAIRHNPHEVTYARLNFALGMLQRRSRILEQKAVAAGASIPAIQAALDVAESGFRDAIDTARIELAEATKSVYRRALINATRNVDFTSSYLGIAHPNANASRERMVKERSDARKRRNEEAAKASDIVAEPNPQHRDRFPDISEESA
jgi:hypothetical protein